MQLVKFKKMNVLITFFKKDWEQINLKSLYCKICHILSITHKSKES